MVITHIMYSCIATPTHGFPIQTHMRDTFEGISWIEPSHNMLWQNYCFRMNCLANLLTIKIKGLTWVILAGTATDSQLSDFNLSSTFSEAFPLKTSQIASAYCVVGRFSWDLFRQCVGQSSVLWSPSQCFSLWDIKISSKRKSKISRTASVCLTNLKW